MKYTQLRTFIELKPQYDDVVMAAICIEKYHGSPEVQYNTFLLKTGRVEVWLEKPLVKCGMVSTVRVRKEPINKACWAYFSKLKKETQ